MGIIDVFGYQI